MTLKPLIRSLELLLGVFLALFPTVSFASADLAGSRPNIVLIMTDDQGYGPVGRHGHPWIKTPSLDALHDRSIRFTSFHVSPTCSPTRSALMTGRYPFKNGVSHTILERERMTLKATTVAQLLQKAGYATGIFGKWHLGDEEPYQPHNRGFDETFIHGAGGIGQAYNCSCADVPGNKYFDPVVRHNRTFVKTRGFCTDVFFTQALGWILSRKESGKPFFAYITTNAPHGPFLAPESYKKRFLDMDFSERQAGFYGMIENIDNNVGRLMARLNEWNLEEKTLVIFLSDNGTTGNGAGRGVLGKTEQGTGLRPYNAGMKGMKGSSHEGGTRVPAFFCWQGKLKAGRDIDRIAAHIDILPTLADLAGAEVPAASGVDGRSLLPLLSDSRPTWPDRYLFFHVGRWKKGSDPDKAKFRQCAVRSQRFRLVNNAELYDMKVDPGQTTNIIDKHPEFVTAMRAAYDVWWKEVRPLLVNENVPLATERPFHVLYRKQLQGAGIAEWKPPRL